jgi:hypothetical protein
MSTAAEQLEQIKTKLAQYQAGGVPMSTLTDAIQIGLQATSGLACSLPPQFKEVLQNILNRLESSALFTEESCSFSQTGLLENLAMWINKAESRLAQLSATSP